MPALSHLHMDPERPVPGVGDGLLTGELTSRAIDAFVEVARADAEFPLVSVELRHLGGELARRRPEHGALSAIEAQYAMFAVGTVPLPELEARRGRKTEAVKHALAPWAVRHMYLNFAETHRNNATFWSEQAYHRLRRIKATVNIARADLDGTHVNHDFIAAMASGDGLAVAGDHIYWDGLQGIGRANLDGNGIDLGFVPIGEGLCGVAVNTLTG